MEPTLFNARHRTVDIPHEVEFWGHCSNLQAWAENHYDTRLLHRNLAFPLLKALAKGGDRKAKIRFKEEIAKRLSSGIKSVILYLFEGGYLKYLSLEELECVLEDPTFQIPDNMGIEFWRYLGTKYHSTDFLEKALKAFERMREKNPSNKEIIKNLADLYTRGGKTTQAVQLYEILVKKENYNSNVWLKLGSLYAHNKNFQKALKTLDMIRTLYPQNPTLLLKVAKIYIFLRKRPQAIKVYKQLTEFKDTQKYARKQLGFLYAVGNEYEKAIKEFETLIKPKYEPPEKKVWLKLRELYEIIGMPHKIIQWGEKIVEKHPNSSTALKQLCTLYIQFGIYEKALEILKKFSTYHPESIFLHFNLGICHLMKNQYEKAIPFFENVIEHTPNNKHVWSRLAYAYFSINRFSKADYALKQSLEIDPLFLNAKVIEALIYSKRGYLNKAKDRLQIILKISSEQLLAWKIIITIYRDEGDADNFLASSDKLKDIAVSFFKKRDYNHALIAFHILRDFNPTDHIVLEHIGLISKDLGQYNKAKKALGRSLVAYPRNAQIWATLGEIHYTLNNYILASHSFKRSLILDYENSTVWFKLGCTFEKLNRFNLAKKSYRLAYRLNKDKADVWFEIGKFHFETSHYHKAITALEKATNIYKHKITTLQSLAIVCLKSLLSDRAFALYQKITKIQKENLSTLIILAHLYILDNSYEKAREIYRKSLKIHPNCQELIDLKNRLRAYN
jgi:tetratricopeptide (TPR) repeat protein